MGNEEKLLEYFKGDELAAGVWKKKYALEGESTPRAMHWRMAREFARIEGNYQHDNEIGKSLEHSKKLSNYSKNRGALDSISIFDLFNNFKYIIPQGSVMSQLGSPSIGSLSNCFVLGQPVDSYGGIFQKDEEMAQLEKRRGGVGLDLSSLRPKGVTTSNAAKTSTGAVSFANRYSSTTEEVAQNGRRGALMLSMDIKHPDSLEFITMKRDLSKITGANTSVKLNKDFMKAVVADEDYILRFPCNKNIQGISTNELPYNELVEMYNVNSINQVKKVKAKEYWESIIKSAHGGAEPGLLFWDRIVDYSPDGLYPQYKAVTTNPCGEIPMQAYDACRLMVVNLFSFVINPFTPKAEFAFKDFYKVNYEAMRLSDDLVDLELEHIDRILEKIEEDPEDDDIKMTEYNLWLEIRRTAKSSRRTGLGFTGLGDTLAALGLGYASEEGIEKKKEIMHVKMESELDCSIDLGVLRGTFEGWDRNIEYDLIASNEIVGNNDFYEFIYQEFPVQAELMYKYGRRNVSWSTVAPTGTTSLMTQTTSGMEPLFLPFHTRRVKINPSDPESRVDYTDLNGVEYQEFSVLHPKFKDWILLNINQVEGKEFTEKDWDKSFLKDAFKESPWYGSTANDIDWTKRVETQATIQKYISHSISSTINLPEDVSEEEVGNIYLEAWKQGVKGITVYREGSRSGILVNNSVVESTFEYRDAIKRPNSLEAKAHTTTIKGNKFTIIVGLLDGKPYECFMFTYDHNYSGKGFLEKVKRGHYRFSDSINTIIIEDINDRMTDEQSAITRLVSTSLRHGANITFIVEQLQKTPGDIFSFTKGLSRVLKKYIPDNTKSTVTCQNPDCTGDGTNVVFEEGCQVCKDCGSGKCS